MLIETRIIRLSNCMVFLKLHNNIDIHDNIDDMV